MPPPRDPLRGRSCATTPCRTSFSSGAGCAGAHETRLAALLYGVWLDLARGERLRKVLSHQLSELVAVEEIDGSALRRVSRVGGEAAEGHVDPLPHELRSRRVDEV